MRATYVGHACVLVESPAGRVIFDPFLTGNEAASMAADQVEVEAILLTHGHGDHVGDAVPLARRLNVPIVAVYELATLLGWQGAPTVGQHIGGSAEYPFGTVKFTPALHGSSLADEAHRTVTYAGQPAGILYTAAGRTVYHLGDTGLSAEFELIGRRHAIDLAFVPIGDHYTMGPEDAAEAVRLLRPRRVVPLHYNTFPVIRQEPERFAALVGDAAEVTILAPGESVPV